MSQRETQRHSPRVYPGSLHSVVVLLRNLESEREQMEKDQKAVWRQAGEQMREARKAAQLSVRETAKELGISAPFLSDMELGRRQPSLKWVEKLQQVIKQHNKDYGTPAR